MELILTPVIHDITDIPEVNLALFFLLKLKLFLIVYLQNFQVLRGIKLDINIFAEL